jgi:type II secretory ATPase GspE/PulE/Tfp pilus assembly ATPase PilB-like protein
MSIGVKQTRDVGDVLVENGRITAKQLELARRRQVRQQVPLHRAVVDLSFASEEETHRALAEVNGMEFVDLTKVTVPREVLDMVPVKIALHFRFIPVSLESAQLTLAFTEPPVLSDLGNLRLLLGTRLKAAITTPTGVHSFIKKYYGLGAQTIQQLRNEKDTPELTEEVVFDVKTVEGAPVMDATMSDFVNQILLEALRLDATDIHIEPYPSTIKLRYRIDGVMQDIPVPAGLRQLYNSIVSRLKVMAGLNIAERRVPHDGRIGMKTGKEEYDLRVSIIPTPHGEAVCLRILGRQSMFFDMAQLGMEPEQQALLEQLTKLPQGMVLLTGPTGSGKTTTLYAALAHANDGSRKIVTIENPIEYQLEGISQIQTNAEVGLTFSSGLRSVLRHDPDVLLIGEIRDVETAEIAVRAAQTGHLVFSTLHTNDSVSAIPRLLDMKIEPFLLASSLVCSIAQRLARRICRHCMEPETDIPDDARQEMAEALKIRPEEVRAWVGKGCVECNQMGYRGRVALYEFFVVNDEIVDLLTPGATASNLRDIGRSYGWKPIREHGWVKVQNGTISIAENQRLTRRVMAPELLGPTSC